jgi:hypothetical protein
MFGQDDRMKTGSTGFLFGGIEGRDDRIREGWTGFWV